MALARQRVLAWMIGGGMLAVLLHAPARATELKPQTVAAYDEYVRATEVRLDSDLRMNRFLVIDRLPEDARRLAYENLWLGQLYIQPLHTASEDGRTIHVPYGLIHDWVAIVFIRGAKLSQVQSILLDFDHQKDIYKPDVRQSKLLDRTGNEDHTFMQFYNRSIITVVLNANFTTYFTNLSPTRAESRSYSTRIAEVQDPGKPGEHELPVGDDHGYLWRLSSYWRLEQSDGGVYVQVESIGLSRSVPFVFSWLVRPLLRSIPQAYLTRLLSDTRRAVLNPGPYFADPK